MDVGSAYLILLCRLEAQATWAWLNYDRTPGEAPMPRSFIRGITGAQIIDKWRREGFDYTQDQVGVMV